MSSSAADVHGFARGILERGDLASKLAPPRDAQGERLRDADPGPRLVIEWPAREPALALQETRERLPKLNALGDPHARALCLSRFAHHELMATELFAWGLLAFPGAPHALRRGLLGALEEEQRHLALYLERLRAHGVAFGAFPLSGYFWRSLDTGPSATLLGFLASLGLTLEQANLDFTLLYRDAFRAAGDENSARVFERVHRDEVGHVRLANHWFCALKGEHRDDVEAYRREVPFPLSAARAKGRRFDAAARRRAGLSEAFIAFVRAAHPYGDRAPAPRPPRR